jgi:putative ABC transport system ATP-binding protein
MTPAGPAIALRDVTRRYRSRAGVTTFELRVDSLAVPAGSTAVVTGRSGSGKTTLLQILAGLDSPDSGGVRLLGQEVRSYSDAAWAHLRGRLGYVPQQLLFLEHLPVWKNVTCRLVPQGVPARTRFERARQVLREVGLEEFATRLPRELSGGEQQRVALARALVSAPDLLIGDEPASNVDRATRAQIVGLLQRLKAGGTTLIIATHDDTLADLADARYVMSDGTIGKA